MLEEWHYKYADQTLFDTACYLLNKDYKATKSANVWQKFMKLGYTAEDFIQAVINEIDFTRLNATEFLLSIDRTKYITSRIDSGLDFYNNYFKYTGWQSQLHAEHFISKILTNNKYWSVYKHQNYYTIEGD